MRAHTGFSFCLILLLSCQTSWSKRLGQTYNLEGLSRRDSEPALPSQDPFYTPDGTAWRSKNPGTILKRRKISTPTLDNLTEIAIIEHAYQLLYTTTNVHGNPSHAVTTVLVPSSPNNRHHVSYQVAYDSPNIDCSPSYGLQPDSSTHAGQSQLELSLVMSKFLALGTIVSVPDYEGPLSAFTVGPESAMGVLDSIRAVLASGDLTGINPQASNVLVGYSGGALASEWAAEYHQDYAPELAIAGAAIGGLPTNVTKTILAVDGTKDAGLIPASMLGIAGTYPAFKNYLKEHLKYNVCAFNIPLRQCGIDQTDPSYGYTPKLSGKVIADWFDNGLDILVEQGPLLERIGVMGLHAIPRFPLFVWKGTADEIAVSLEDTNALVEKYCSAGTSIQYQRYVGANHGDAALKGVPGAVQFAAAVFAGHGPTDCSTIDVLM